MIMTACQPSFAMSWPREKFLDSLSRGLAATGAATAMHEGRLRIALELYFSSHLESLSSRFITQVMALEVLSAPPDRHPAAHALLTRWTEEVESAREANAASSYPDKAIERALIDLKQSALFANKKSKTSSLHDLVLETLTHLPGAERSERAKEIVRAYGHRGSLIHDGERVLAFVEKMTAPCRMDQSFQDLSTKQGAIDEESSPSCSRAEAPS